jgi:hypothetical protein
MFTGSELEETVDSIMAYLWMLLWHSKCRTKKNPEDMCCIARSGTFQTQVTGVSTWGGGVYKVKVKVNVTCYIRAGLI